MGNETSNVNVEEEVILRKYWETEKEETPLHSLIRILQHCLLTLLSSAKKELDPYRNSEFLGIGEHVQETILKQSEFLEDLDAFGSPPSIRKSKSLPIDPNINTKNIFNNNINNNNGDNDKVEVKSEIVNENNGKKKGKRKSGENGKGTTSRSKKIQQEKIEIDPPKSEIEFTPSGQWNDKYKAEWIMAKIIHHSLPELERRKQYDWVCCYYRVLLSNSHLCHRRRGKWWERLTLTLLSHLKDSNLALKVCLVAMEDPLLSSNCCEKFSIIKRLTRILKAPLCWKTEPKFPVLIEAPSRTVKGELLFSKTGRKNVWKPLLPPLLDRNFSDEEQLEEDDLLMDLKVKEGEGVRGVGVEEFVIQWFQQEGWEGLHCEGSLLFPLFTLFFYDVLFSDVPFVFQTKFQGSFS